MKVLRQKVAASGADSASSLRGLCLPGSGWDPQNPEGTLRNIAHRLNE